MKIVKFLSGKIEKNNLGDLLRDRGLKNVDTKDFFRKFGQMSQDELVAFLKDEKNDYELAKFGYRYGNHNKIPVNPKINGYNYNVSDQAY